VLLVDAREPEAYRSGHLPGAVNLPPSTLERAVVLAGGAEIHHLLARPERAGAVLAQAGLRREWTVVLYDEGAGHSAARVFWILDYFGHPHLRILNGGLAAWLLRRRRLSSSLPARKRGDFTPRPDPRKLADFRAVRDAVRRQGAVLLNSLPESSFAAQSIPGSVNIPYTKTYLDYPPGRLQSPVRLRELFLEASIRPHQEVILYCGIGYTASQLYFAARLLGYPRLRLYDGSMEEWKARGGRVVPGRVRAFPNIDLANPPEL
jgi:thiosulfate/3-mercaptopyruvate sulfurtransferase